MWHPSIAPTVCGMPYSSINSFIFSSLSLLANGKLINWSLRLIKAFSNSQHTVFAVDFPSPNCSPQVLKLFPVADLQSDTATLFSTLTGSRMRVCCLCKSARRRSQIASKVGRVNRKCNFHRGSISRRVNNNWNHCWGRGQTQTLRLFSLGFATLCILQYIMRRRRFISDKRDNSKNVKCIFICWMVDILSLKKRAKRKYSPTKRHFFLRKDCIVFPSRRKN